MKKKFYLVLDVETCNSTDDALVYDLGYAVCDKKGNVYETESLIVADIFNEEKELMQSAYYAQKLPQYYAGIEEKVFKVRTLAQCRALLIDVMRRYSIDTVCAYNANFDYSALNTTQRYLTKSKYRYFLPYGTKVFCIWHMACQVICTQKSYIKFCLRNGFVSESGNIKTSAESVFAYMTQDETFEECHTGLQDVLIEVQIMAKCFAQHKKMEKNINRLCWRIPQKKKKELGL